MDGSFLSLSRVCTRYDADSQRYPGGTRTCWNSLGKNSFSKRESAKQRDASPYDPMNGAFHSALDSCRRYRRLPPESRKLVFRAALRLTLSTAALRILGFPLTRRILDRFSFAAHCPPPAAASADSQRAALLSRAASSVERHAPFRANCLERSLALWWSLRSEGLAAELRIGARKESGELLAHAWVECDGRVLNDSPDVHALYALFDASIARTRFVA